MCEFFFYLLIQLISSSFFPLFPISYHTYTETKQRTVKQVDIVVRQVGYNDMI